MKVSSAISIEHLQQENERLKAELASLKANVQKATGSESKVDYRLLDTLNEAILQVDNEERIVYANRCFCRLFGYKREELVGQSTDIMVPKSSKKELSKRRAERTKGVSSRYELPMRHKSGEIRYFEISGSPVFDANKKVVGSIGIHIDVTVKRQALALLRESESKYRTLVERMNEGVVITDLKNTVLFANKRFSKLTGFKMDELLGKSALDILTIKNYDRKTLRSKFQERFSGKSEVYEINILNKKREEKWLKVSATPVYNDRNEIIGSMGIFSDITQQKKAESTNERLYTIINSTTDFIGVSDYRGNTISLNASGLNMLGLKEGNYLHRRWEEFYEEQSIQKVKGEVMQQILKQGIWKGELTMKTEQGTLVPVSQVTFCKKDKQGRIEFIASIARDITDLKQAQKEISLLARMPDETPSPLLRVSAEGLISYANKASNTLLQFWKTAPGKALPKVWLKVVKKVLDTQREKEFEIDCGKRIYELKLVPVVEYGYVNIIGADITHKKKAEGQLIASEKKYRAVVEDQTELISRYQANGTITFANAAYCRYFGVKLDEVVGKKLSTFIPPGARKKFLERLATLNRENPVVTYSQQIKHKGVTQRWQMWTDRAIYDDNGNFIEYQSVGRDITELKEAEMEVRKKELYLRKVIDTIPNLIAVKDPDGTYRMVNKAFADYVGKRVNTIPGSNEKDFFGFTNAQLAERILKNNAAYVIEEERGKRKKDGNLQWFQTTLNPLILENNLQQILSISTDITQLKSIQDMLTFQLEFKELVSLISARFINIQVDEIDDAIYQALMKLGNYLSADQCVIQLADSASFAQNKFSWTSPNCKRAMIDEPQKLLTSNWAMDELVDKGYLYMPDTKLLAGDSLLRQQLAKFKVRSLFTIPLQSKNIQQGYLSIMSYTEETRWPDYSILLFKILAQIFSSALERKATEMVIQERMELENIITTLSTNFINIPPQMIDDEINAAIKIVCQLFHIDQGYLFLSNANGKQFVMRNYWFDNIHDAKERLKSVSAKEHVALFKYIKAEGVFEIPRIQALGKDAVHLRALMQQFEVKSLIFVPIIFNGELNGVLAFGSKYKEQFWREETVPMLKILGQVLANALERKQTEESLNETKELYRTLARNIPKAAVLLFDTELRYRLVEGAALEEQGYSKENIEGKTIYDVLPQSRLKILEPLYKEALQGKVISMEREFNNKHYLIHILPVKSDAGEIYAGMVMSLDISDLKEIQYQLEEQAKVLKRSNEELELFAYAASHDLQEPLRMISSYVGLIQRRLANESNTEIQEFMEFAVNGVIRMQQLINDLLEYSRVDRRGGGFKQVDMAQVAEYVKLNLKSATENSKAQIILKPLPTILADKPQMVSLLQNLIGNAIKFVANNTPTVEVACREYKNYWRFSVKDNGIGIEEKYHERIFVIFQRLNSRKEYEGTGMGLAICKKIVERHRGRIWLKSEPGKGTTFYFEISKRQHEF
ncbi:MAG: PAS domain S-box protein [Chitinophagales bacterium]|nr:PAS domain S-box protein [Chitinophagales bacterium]